MVLKVFTWIMVQIPKTVKIGAHYFSVEQVEGAKLDDDNGDCSMNELKIRIRKDIPDSLKLETLIHETIHVIQQLNDTENKDEEKDEHNVQILGHALTQFLLDNKCLIC